MNPERWEQITRICDTALELKPGRQADFLQEACGGDESLRQEVESLLARQSLAEGFLEVPAIDEAAMALAQDPDPESDLVGRTLHHYRITGRIGVGGMGVVYRAEDTHLGRLVAVKVLLEVFARDAARLKRFEREARLLATLSHPNIASIFGLEEVDGRSFLVLEWVEGLTLEERLKKGPIPVDEALGICCQIAEGLEAAHEKGIIHRDLKPPNTQLTSESRVKILDFGLAKALHGEEGAVDLSSEAADSMTGSGVILGTVAYMRIQADTKKRSIMIISPLGGHERKLTECAALRVVWAPPPLAWTPDSRFLAIVDSATGDLPNALFLVSIETGERRQLTFPLGSKGTGDCGMSFSPDGRNLSFLRSTGHYMWDLFLLPLSKDFTRQGEPRRLTFDNGSFFCGPAWASGGKDLVFAANRGGAARQLWRINVSGREPAQLIPVPYEAGFGLAISPRGDRLIYQTGGLADNDIWKLDLAQRDGQAGFPTRLIASSYMDNDPHFSPDGRKVVFQSNRTGTGTQIWVADSSGGNPLQLTRFKANSGGACWSPDSRRIVFDSNVHGNRDIFVVDADGGAPRALLTDPSEELLPRWSRDGKWIYFSSLRSGGYQLWKIPVSGGEAIQVTRKGGLAAEESEDGAYLYYTKREFDTSLWRVPTAGGEEVQIAESVVVWNGFSVGRDGVYFVSHAPPPEPGSAPQHPFEVRFHRFADGATQTVAGLEEYYQGLSVSPDGRTLLFNRTATRSGIDLMLVDGFK